MSDEPINVTCSKCGDELGFDIFDADNGVWYVYVDFCGCDIDDE